MNTGTPDQAREVGALMYVGQPEYDAGFAAGIRAKGEGVTKFLCVNHDGSQPLVSVAVATQMVWASSWATQ